MNEIYPYSFGSTNLIDFFLICGYEYSYIYNKLLNDVLEEFENEANQNNKNLFIYIPKFKPSILNSICSFDYQKDMISENNIIDYTFLNVPKIYYNDKNKIDINKNIKNKNIIFFNSSFGSETKNIYNAFAYKFYESFSIKNIKVFIPKAFIFISEYPFFKLFKNISEEILIQYKNEKLEIPIEIQLFNILNFLPNSLKNTINFNLFQELNLKDNNNIINNESNLNKFKLNKISGFPFFDIDISEIFKIIPVDLLIEIFIFSFLEIKINIFYKDLEYLNLLIYIINSFSYPIDTQYNWQVISLSKEDIFDQENSIFDKPIPSIMGFNCNYDNEIENRFLYSGSHFSFDLKNKIFEFYSQDEKELDDIKTLQIRIKKSLKSNESFLQGILNNLYDRLINIYNEKFKDKEKLNENYNFFNSKDNFNIEIQEAFYEFNINFSALFNKFFVNTKDNKQININYKLDNTALTRDENLFYFFFEVTLKSGVMIELFEQQKFPSYNTLSYLLYYESTNLKILNNSFSHYFDLINYFYENNNNNILNIDFVNFYNFYQDNLKEYFFNESKYSKIINSFKNKDNNLYFYNYNIIELDNNLLFEYINLINNLNKEQFNKILNNYKNDLIFKNNCIKYVDFYYQLEDYFLSKNIMNKNELIIFVIFYLIIFLVQKINLEYFSNIIQQNVFLLKFNINKNIELIFECYLKLLQNKVKLFTNFSFFTNIIEVLLFHKNNPNINVIKLYNQIINYINENKYEFSNESNKFIEKILDIENSEIYNIKLIKANNNNEIINEIESYKKTIEDNNESEILYKNEIMINFISNYNNKNININSEIYSIKFLYNEIKSIINEYSLNYDFDKINKKKINFVLINLIFNIDYIFKFSNKLSKLVYLCLFEEKNNIL